MERIDGPLRSRARTWVALAGLLLLGTLAIGFLGAGADASPPASAAGYGGGGSTGGYGNGNGQAPCRKAAGGYNTVPCPSQVTSVVVKPATPRAGKGFKVTFASKSGGAYKVVAKRKGKATELESGATGAGKTTTNKVGEDLKAGKYKIVVSVSSGRGGADTARHTLKIKKA
jgi:plastocyanin